MTTKIFILAPLFAFCETMQAEIIGTYDFEGAGTEFTAKNVAPGITLSDLSINSLANTLVKPQTDSLTGMSTGNYLSIPGNSGTSGSTGNSMTNGIYLSFSLRNSSGEELYLSSLNVTVGGDNIYNYFLARVFTDVQGFEDATGDTIGRVGQNPAGGGAASFSATVNTINFSSPEGANINYPSDFTVANGATINFYLPFIHPSTSASRIGEIDSIQLQSGTAPPPPGPQTKPNILCLVAEDMSPNLGCYGDSFATTPHIDNFAANGLRYLNVWSNAPACSPARSTLIAGLYGTTTGSTSHRNQGGAQAPSFLKFYSRQMQELGYYTANRGKEDYNIGGPNGGKGWNASSGSAHWNNRPTSTTPFLAVFNFFPTHESSLNNTPNSANLNHDANSVPLPPYHPDVPVIRNQWAKHYDTIERFDDEVKARLDELAAAGAEDDTIVIVYSDHGTCIPGGKRYVGNRGQRIPLIIYFPPKWEHLAPPGYTAGGTSDELVSFVDFAPTLLSLAGEEEPAWHHGRAFAGEHYEPERDYLYGYTDRMGERTWLTRSVFDGRYVYIRNYRPDQPHGHHNEYGYDQTFAGTWQSLFHQGDLTPDQAHYWNPQGPEELYDLQTDPHELTNLITDPASQTKLNELRTAHLNWRDTYRDLAFLTEGIMHELKRDSGKSEYDLLYDDSFYPKADLFDTIDRASLGTPSDIPTLVTRTTHSHPSIRHWSLIGLMLQGRETVRAHEATILSRFNDASESLYVRATAAQVLATHGSATNQSAALNYLFAESRDTGASLGSNWFAEREILAHMHALDQVPFIPASYEPQLDTFETSTSWTSGFKDHIHRSFYEQFHNPLLEFRHIHGLNRYGTEDHENPSGDGISNILKFAFNLAPDEGDLLTPSTSPTLSPGGDRGLPTLHRSENGDINFEFIRRIPLANSSDSSVLPTSNVTYMEFFSGDLLNWTPGLNPTSVQAINAEWERVIYTFPPGTSPGKQFQQVELRQ